MLSQTRQQQQSGGFGLGEKKNFALLGVTRGNNGTTGQIGGPERFWEDSSIELSLQRGACEREREREKGWCGTALIVNGSVPAAMPLGPSAKWVDRGNQRSEDGGAVSAVVASTTVLEESGGSENSPSKLPEVHDGDGSEVGGAHASVHTHHGVCYPCSFHGVNGGTIWAAAQSTSVWF